MRATHHSLLGLELQFDGMAAHLIASGEDKCERRGLLRKVGVDDHDILTPGQWRPVPPLGEPEVILLMASRKEEDTLRHITSLRERFSAPPLFLLIDTEEVLHLERTLSLEIDDFHELKGGPHLLKARIEKWRNPKPWSNNHTLLASEEAAIWRTLFHRAGAGMLTGKSERFWRKLPVLLPASLSDGQDWNTFIQSALSEIDWEINNASASDLLELQDPVLLSRAFISRLESLNPEKFASEMLLLGRTKPTIHGEFLLKTEGSKSRKLAMELSIPGELENIILATFTDITERVELELNLREHVNLLETRVEERTRAMRKVNSQLETESKQRQHLAKQVRENLVNITQGVISAKKILEVALPGKKELRATFPHSFLLDRPRDIMGGDFIFTAEKNGKKYLALIDSTGHGIPGAMVSLMGSTLINRAFAEIDEPTPSEILYRFHEGFRERMQSSKGQTNMYGFDAGILMLDESIGQLTFSGARGDLYLVQRGVTRIFRGTRQSIEMNKYRKPEEFTCDTYSINLQSGDQLYMITDGVRDQFGGHLNRKLGRKRFADILSSCSHLDIWGREKAIQQSLLIWKGPNAKVDDEMLVGLVYRVTQENLHSSATAL